MLKSSRSCSPSTCSRPATHVRTPWTSTESSACAAASSTCFRLAMPIRFASSSSATAWSRFADTTRQPSARSTRSTRSHVGADSRAAGDADDLRRPKSTRRRLFWTISRFDRPAVFVISEPEEARTAAEKFTEQIEASYQAVTSVARGPRAAAPVAVAPPARLFVDLGRGRRPPGECDPARAARPRRCGASPVPAAPSHHVRYQPVPEFNGRIQDLVAAIKPAQGAG